MGKTTGNFNDDLPPVRRYLAERVRAQAKIDKAVTAIEVGFRLSQAGLVAVNFDTRATHEVDWNWTGALSKFPLKLPHWQAAFEANDTAAQSYVLLNGKRL